MHLNTSLSQDPSNDDDDDDDTTNEGDDLQPLCIACTLTMFVF